MIDLKSLITPKQREVVSHLVNGASHKQIAQLLGMKTTSVNAHLRRLRERMGAKSIFHAACILVASGEISVNFELDTPLNQRPNGGNGDDQNENKSKRRRHKSSKV